MDEPLAPDRIRAAAFAAFKTFHREKNDLDTYVTLGQTVIEACMALADKYPDRAAEYKSVALPTSYNVAAACWPGWEDAPEDIAADKLETALELCRFNVALGEELGIPPERAFNGQWILGVHLIAQSHYAEAKQCFSNASDLARSNDASTMARGWVLVCDILDGQADKQSELTELEQELAAMGEDGEFYAGQYAPALRKFRRHAA